MVGPGRFELPTSPLSGVRSNQLSYGPELLSVIGVTSRCRAATTCTIRGRKRNMGGDAGLHPNPTTEVMRTGPSLKRQQPDWPSSCSKTDRYGGPGRRSEDRGPGGRQRSILRKEVIQPQVLLRLPCYDFTPVADPTVVACLLAVSATPSGRTNSHGVTGGVYKARERIHRGVLIHDY